MVNEGEIDIALKVTNNMQKKFGVLIQVETTFI